MPCFPGSGATEFFPYSLKQILYQTGKELSLILIFLADAYQLKEVVKDLETQLKTSDLEKQHFKEEVKKLKKELENFDPSFFEEIEDLKYNYKEEVKKNILLEEKLKKLSEQFGVELTSPVAASEQLEDEEESPTNFPTY
ncbi:hypothetical protein MC885_014523 [Smutsia gigantea]|nr:hypothetical protein MC885_014523 [Smutsia gigantea]